MSFVVDLPPAQEDWLQQEATRYDVSVSELVFQAVRVVSQRSTFTTTPYSSTLVLLEQWIAEAPTTPDEITEAEADLRQFQQAINQTREAAGAQPVYPGVL